MMQTIFIALQCSQCSTMQVKQKKKSSNKWTCVVCNQKQSVRKVFAQGFMAKDLRKFVQSFNMSRKIADEQLDSLDQEAAPLIPTSLSQTDHIGLNDDYQRKRRSDWTEYLDAEEDYNIKQEDEGEESGPMVVTELPKEMFKKPKLRKYDSGPSSGDRCDGDLYKPVFSKRNASKTVMSQVADKELRKYQYTKTAVNSQWNDCLTRTEEEARTSQPTTRETNASKWNDYRQDDDGVGGGGFNFGRERNVEAHHQSYGDWETILDDDQKVEDDVHPDFM